jgi:pimaricinolide synthase PimS1
MVKALEHEVLPTTLHVDRPSRKVDWSGGHVQLLTEPIEWPRNGQPRRAGISSFGVSGTNAHVIIEEALPPSSESQPDESLLASDPTSSGVAPNQFGSSSAEQHPFDTASIAPWVLSGKGERGLRAQAARLFEFAAENPQLDAAGIAASLTDRAQMSHRAVLLGEGRTQLLSGLEAVAGGRSHVDVLEGVAGAAHEVVFVFPGQGPQWAGMGVELLRSSPLFAAEMHCCDEALREFVDWSLVDVIRDEQGSPDMDSIEVLQPVLFAVMVSLAALWRACGVEPAAVVGHSQGEIAAAYVAGGLSLQDAARVVALRSRALARLRGAGIIASIGLSAAELEPRLSCFDGRLSIASINGPASVGVAGDERAVRELVGELKAEGVRVQEIASTVASHSPSVEPLKSEALELLSAIEPRSATVPLYSTVTATLLDSAQMDAEYWYENMRQPVRFEAVTRSLLEDGFRTYVEVSPHPVLSLVLQETIDDEHGANSGALIVGSLRRNEGDAGSFLRSLGELWAGGGTVSWKAALGDPSRGQRVRLPTYAFDRQRHWLEGTPLRDGALGAAGQLSSGHPLLAAVVPLADSDRFVLTGRLSLSTHPWLAEHAMLGTVLLSAAGFIELAWHAATQVGCQTVEELTLDQPLLIPQDAGVQIQISVDQAAGDGRRSIAIYARPETSDDNVSASAWTCHASGVLGATPRSNPAPRAGSQSTWPPIDAEPVDIDQLYERLAETGVEYDPDYRGLCAAWRSADEVLAEVRLSSEKVAEVDRFGVHVALLEPALHAMAIEPLSHIADTDQAPGKPRMPFAWSDVTVHATGACCLRIAIAWSAPDEASITARDEADMLVFSAKLTLREVPSELIAQARATTAQKSLFTLRWRQTEHTVTSAGPSLLLLCGDDAPLTERLRSAAPDSKPQAHLDLTSILRMRAANTTPKVVAGTSVLFDLAHEHRSGDVVADAHAVAHDVFTLVQSWLAEDQFASDRLVVITHGAIATSDGEPINDLAGTVAWGLLRSAQLENLGRLMLIDIDDADESWRVLPSIISGDELQIALREGQILIPRMQYSDVVGDATTTSLDPDRTVLITGGTGGLGELVARHVVAQHSVRSLVLTSRRGLNAHGARELQAELEQMGARVTIASCDVSQREELRRTLEAIPADFPLGAVIHAAGISEDGIVQSLTAESVHSVLRPKVDGAWNLHELTEGLNLRAFVLYSSIASVMGNPGAANYGAANAFLDALAVYRRTRGLSATSIAWGLWEQPSHLRSKLSTAHLERIGSLGIKSLPSAEGLDLFELAQRGDNPLQIAARLDFSVLRGLAREGLLLPQLRDVVRAATHVSHGSSNDLVKRLANASADERETIVRDFLSEELAVLLGHAAAETVDTECTFKELGFDSLAVVQLRNRLNAATGLSLPTTLVFNYPTPNALTCYIEQQLRPRLASHSGLVEDGIREIDLALTSKPPEHPAERERLAARLRAALTELEASGSSGGDGDLVERIRTASGDELLALCERELASDRTAASPDQSPT